VATLNGTVPPPPNAWDSHFSGLDPAARAAQRQVWQRLTDAHGALSAVHQASGLAAAEVERLLAGAARRLDVLRPYRVVVVGETGAGKSMLINGWFGRELVSSMSGGAVTGVPTYIYPQGEAPVDQMRAAYRSAEDFGELLGLLGGRFGLELPGTLEALEALLLQPELDARLGAKVPEHMRGQLRADLVDIAGAWRHLSDEGLLGQRPSLEAFSPEQMRRLTEEDGDREASRAGGRSPRRKVPGIAHVELHLGRQGPPDDLGKVVVIDTPGLGARRLRHREVMQLEIARADAVILVINAERPVKQGEALDAILRAELFNGYTDAERSAFAGKVFLVVNRIDSIRKDEERHLLGLSLREIADSIAPDYLARRGPGSADRRVFEVSAEPGALARRLMAGERLGADDGSRFRSYLPLLGVGEDEHAPTRAWEQSGLPMLLAALRHFLAGERLRMSLAEAERDLHAAARTLREAGKQALAARGLGVEALAGAGAALGRHRRQLCLRMLGEQRRALVGAQEQVTAQLQRWRHSPAHREGLTRVVGQIYRELGAVVEAELRRLAAPNGDLGLIVDEPDDISGKVYTEGRVYALLLQVERHTRSAAEDASALLADYYLGAFRSALTAGDLLGQVKRAGHGQAYVDALDPAGALEVAVARLGEEYRQICRASLLYELIQRPLLLPQAADRGATLWGVVAAVAPRIAEEGVTMLMESVGVAGGLARSAAAAVGALVEQRGTSVDAVLASQAPARTLDNPLAIPEGPFLTQGRLVAEIVALLHQGDRESFRHLVGEQLALRIHTSVGMLLPTVENLFFYQLGKFRRVFAEQAAAIEQAHAGQVAADAGIVGLLLEPSQPDFAFAQQIVDTLSALDSIAIA
jgi:GTPase SAR1 family protein